MGARSRAGWVAVAALAAAGGAGAQPEYVRWETGGETYAAVFDVEGDLIAWTSKAPPPAQHVVTFIHRRTEHGWAPEAELAGTVRENYAYTVIDGDRVACWGTSISQGVRIYRHGDDGWLREPAYLPGNEWLLAGGVGDMDGEWMVMSRYAEWQWPDGLALVYRFDGRAWRFHSALVAPGLEGYHGGTLAIEDDLIAVHAGSLDEPHRFVPQALTYSERGLAWDAIDPALQAFKQMPSG